MLKLVFCRQNQRPFFERQQKPQVDYASTVGKTEWGFDVYRAHFPRNQSYSIGMGFCPSINPTVNSGSEFLGQHIYLHLVDFYMVNDG